MIRRGLTHVMLGALHGAAYVLDAVCEDLGAAAPYPHTYRLAQLTGAVARWGYAPKGN